MSKKNDLISELNPSLVILRDNKAKWYLPETRRDGYRNLHKINGTIHKIRKLLHTSSDCF